MAARKEQHQRQWARYTHKFSLSLTPQDRQRLEEIAKEEGISVSELTRRILTNFFNGGQRED